MTGKQDQKKVFATKKRKLILNRSPKVIFILITYFFSSKMAPWILTTW